MLIYLEKAVSNAEVASELYVFTHWRDIIATNVCVFSQESFDMHSQRESSKVQQRKSHSKIGKEVDDDGSFTASSSLGAPEAKRVKRQSKIMTTDQVRKRVSAAMIISPHGF